MQVRFDWLSGKKQAAIANTVSVFSLSMALQSSRHSRRPKRCTTNREEGLP